MFFININVCITKFSELLRILLRQTAVSHNMDPGIIVRQGVLDFARESLKTRAIVNILVAENRTLTKVC